MIHFFAHEFCFIEDFAIYRDQGQWLQLGWLACWVCFHLRRWASSPLSSSSFSALLFSPFVPSVTGKGTW